jgi:hypothetical protein
MFGRSRQSFTHHVPHPRFPAPGIPGALPTLLMGQRYGSGTTGHRAAVGYVDK